MNGVGYAVLVWVIVAGLIGGASIDAKAKRCGGPVLVSSADAASWLVWPIVLGVAVTVDNDSLAHSLAHSPCDNEQPQEVE